MQINDFVEGLQILANLITFTAFPLKQQCHHEL